MAQSCNPATGGQGYLDGASHLGLLTWPILDWLVLLLGLETQAYSNRVLTTRNCGTAPEQWILLAQMWAERITK